AGGLPGHEPGRRRGCLRHPERLFLCRVRRARPACPDFRAKRVRRMSGRLLEVAANSVASARAAQAGGAGRVELCAALEVGGLTPSHGMIALARECLDIAVYVLVRPRAGDFVYV